LCIIGNTTIYQAKTYILRSKVAGQVVGAYKAYRRQLRNLSIGDSRPADKTAETMEDILSGTMPPKLGLWVGYMQLCTH